MVKTLTASLITPPSRIRQRRLTRRTLLFLLFLGFLLGTNLLSNWAFMIKVASAASTGPLPGAPASMTFQQFLTEGNPSKAYQGSFRRPADQHHQQRPEGRPGQTAAQRGTTHYARADLYAGRLVCAPSSSAEAEQRGPQSAWHVYSGGQHALPDPG